MTEGAPSPEIAWTEARWSDQDLRSYLLAQSHNTPFKDFTLKQSQFPEAIALNAAWHETFDSLRARTARDQHEYWALVGVDEKRQRVFTSRQFSRGEMWIIPSRVIDKALSDARGRGISYFVGDIHTHPDWLVGKLLTFADQFSTEDLYRILYARSAPVMTAVAGPTRNTLAFRSQESQLVPFADQKNFARFWYRRHFVHEVVGDTQHVNFDLGRRYSLVFYQGSPHQPLKRIFP
jgi:hypothetical protein